MITVSKDTSSQIVARPASSSICSCGACRKQSVKISAVQGLYTTIERCVTVDPSNLQRSFICSSYFQFAIVEALDVLTEVVSTKRRYQGTSTSNNKITLITGK